MSEPFLSEIRIMSFNFPPEGWARCDGQLLPIGQNQALFALLKTVFGGDGKTTFALPDMRGRAPIHIDASHALGTRGGQETHVLSVEELPGHTHALNASSVHANAVPPLPTDHILADCRPMSAYGPADNLVSMQPGSLSQSGGSQAHPNMQPYLALDFCIALEGVFPARN